MIDYFILGTSHEIQDTPVFKAQVMDALRKHSIELVAEEYPFKIDSKSSECARRLGVSYLQVDLLPEEWLAYGINEEMRLRSEVPCLANDDYRFSNADSVREKLWLDKIRATVRSGRVLVICGYLHVDFLVEDIVDQGDSVIEKATFPKELIGRRPTRIFGLLELDEYLKRRRDAG